MEALRPGIEYLINTSDKSSQAKPVHLVFCHKDGEGRFINGHTTEELLDMLINRQIYMVNKDDSSENIRCLNHLRQAKDACSQRNQRKMEKNRNRNVGTGNGTGLQAGG